MHWVDRGAEPAGLAVERERYTIGWLAYANGPSGTKQPNDSAWRKFRAELYQVFHGLCGYCEEITRGEVDHFRPKKRFPALTYDWSNWVFACNSCNLSKKEKWPAGGYVDPCAKSRGARPESFFQFDIPTRKICPKKGISPARARKARQTIVDLGLNDIHHLAERERFILLLTAAIPEKIDERDAIARELSSLVVLRSEEMSNIARSWLADRGCVV